MKRTKEQIERTKAEAKRTPRKRTLGRPQRTEPTERLTVYMPEAVSVPMREHIEKNRDTVSNYITRVVERDLKEAAK
jgi:hypothetical protein